MKSAVKPEEILRQRFRKIVEQSLRGIYLTRDDTRVFLDLLLDTVPLDRKPEELTDEELAQLLVDAAREYMSILRDKILKKLTENIRKDRELIQALRELIKQLTEKRKKRK
jgi:hypothetical protein